MRLKRRAVGLNAALTERFLEFDYKNFVAGGWRQNERWVSQPHSGLAEFHEAAKALFCPCCTRCGKHQRDGLCDNLEPHAVCWHPCGSAPVRAEAGGEGEDAVRACPEHGEFHWRRAQTYTTLLLVPGNRWSKTSGGLAEFCSWILGYRPWDDTLTLQQGNGRVFLIVCQTLSVSALLTIQKYVVKYLGKRIKEITTTSNSLSGWRVVRGPTAGDIIKLASQDQHYRTVATVSPLEGSAYVAVFNDEPFNEDLRASWTRGLLEGKTVWGWGREILAMTFLEGSAQARAHCFGSIWGRAGNRGGSEKQIWARGGTMDENPANTTEDVRQTLESFPPWEREARRTGMMVVLRGRILAEFDIPTHVWDDRERDVLYRPGSKTEPSNWPLYLAVDPHDVRPWWIALVAIDPNGEWWIVREWPLGAFRDMRHYSNATQLDGRTRIDGSFEGYSRVLTDMAESVPGGRARIRRWLMDPGFGDSEKAGSSGTVVTKMRQQGFYFETGLPREVEPGHAILRDLLRGSMEEGKPIDELHHPHLHVAKSCSNTIWAFMNYCNDDGKDPSKFREKPGEAGKDQIDVLRYIAMSQPRYRAWQESNTDIAAQITMLASRMRR